MKKLIAVAIAMLMLLAVLASCANDGGNNDGAANGDETTDVVTTVETDKWSQEVERNDVPDELDYQGMEIGVASRPEARYRREICKEKAEDPLDMQILIRNTNVEKNLNVKLKYIEAIQLWDRGGKDAQGNYYSIYNFVKTESDAGVQSNVDVIFANAAYAVDNSMRGYLVNLNGEELKYLNINKRYWNQSYVQNATCYDQLYYIVGDLTLTIYDKAIVTFVNLDKAENNMGVTAEELYACVNDGQWYFQKYHDYVTNYTYLDNNNNFTVDAGDDIRISSVFASESYDGYYAAFNMSLLTTNDDGTHTINVDGNDKLDKGATKVYNLYSEDGIFKSSSTGNFTSLFTTGYSLFHIDILYRNADSNEKLRSTEFNYGILPLPMYEDTQGAYYTSPQDAYNSISVLGTHPDKLEAIGAFLELMASGSYNEVRPFYVEKMIKGEYAADSESVKMIEKIFDGLIFQTEWVYSFQVNRLGHNMWRECCGGTTVTEQWAKMRADTEEQVRLFDMWFQTTQGK